MLEFHKQRRDGGRLVCCFVFQGNWALHCSQCRSVEAYVVCKEVSVKERVWSSRWKPWVAEKTLQPHTFSRCVRREAKGQLRSGLSAEKFPTQLLLLSSGKNVTVWESTLHKSVTFWNGTILISLSPHLVLRGHPSWCPHNQQRPLEVSRGFSVRITIRCGVFIPFPHLGSEQDRAIY